MVDSANRRISEAFRREAGLMTPEEIRAGRLRCGLDQQTFADLLGIAVSTLSRWETGAQIQQRSLNRLMEAYFTSPEVREVYGRLSGGESGARRAAATKVARKEKGVSGGSKMTTMTEGKQRSAAESPGATREWALKTCPGNDLECSYWPEFVNEGVISVGWQDIDVDPSRVSRQELRQAIERVYPKNATDPAWRENDPAGATRKIATFVNVQGGDLVLICRGYPAKSKKPVRIYGFARVTGPFEDYPSAGWPWRFKHKANIQRVDRNLPRDQVAQALRREALIGTIHELDQGSIERVAELLGIEVEV
jgi:DNA-binding transcriptional regulator YiaG